MIDRGLFVTATGTDVGKTYVSCAIIRALRDRGIRVAPRKPVLSGFEPDSWRASDAGALIEAAGGDRSDLDRVAPFRFRAPLSPDMAAAREGRMLRLDDVLKRIEADAEPGAFHLVEGVGGVQVPIETPRGAAGGATVRDLMKALELPLVLVAGTYLGTLSHTLTAADSLARVGLEPALVVLSESEHQPVPAEETAQVLQRHGLGPIRILARLPASEGPRLDLPEALVGGINQGAS